MAVDVKDLATGKCFVTTTNQVRRIKEMTGDKVKYESRGRKAGSWNSFVTVDEGNFASDVDREVSCDFDPDFSS